MIGCKQCRQRVQVLSGGHGARTYQDERFSYVVMRRGPRPGPESIPDLTLARQRQVDPPDAVQRAVEAGGDSPFSPPSSSPSFHPTLLDPYFPTSIISLCCPSPPHICTTPTTFYMPESKGALSMRCP